MYNRQKNLGLSHRRTNVLNADVFETLKKKFKVTACGLRKGSQGFKKRARR